MTTRELSIFERMARHRGQRKGHLIDRSGSWLLRYWADSADKIDEKTGKPKRERITVTVADSKGPRAIGIREARRIAWEEYLSTVDQAHMRPSSAKTFREFVDLRYRPDVIAFLKPSTQAFAESILRKHVLPMLGPVPLRNITPGSVQDVINAKVQQKLSPQTLTHIRNRVSAVLRHAKAHKWFFGELPTEAVRLPEMQRKERRALTWAQVCALSHALSEPCATLVVFLVLTGLRIGEAMGLRWKRTNLTQELRIVDGEIVPPMSLLVRENYVMHRYQSLKTGTSYRTVPIPEWFAPRLASICTRDAAIAENTGLPVFANLTGALPIDQHNLQARVLKPAARALNLQWVSWHTFRHTNRSLAEQAGMTVSESMKMLGHSSAIVSLGYSHPELERMRPRIEAMVDPSKLLN